ncbi:MAG: hypothetical protein Kow0049_28100 [Stanieria sp.]
MQVNLSPDSTTILAGFHALSDPLRFAVVELLKQQELCVCDLCDRLKVNQSKLSFHLKTLKEADLIIPRQEGRWIYYSLSWIRCSCKNFCNSFSYLPIPYP